MDILACFGNYGVSQCREKDFYENIANAEGFVKMKMGPQTIQCILPLFPGYRGDYDSYTLIFSCSQLKSFWINVLLCQGEK
jgi:hypothetical protein